MLEMLELVHTDYFFVWLKGNVLAHKHTQLITLLKLLNIIWIFHDGKIAYHDETFINMFILLGYVDIRKNIKVFKADILST